MTTFETLQMSELRHGRDRFLQVARKRATSDTGRTDFVALTSGIFNHNARRFKTNLSLPDDQVLLAWVALQLLYLAGVEVEDEQILGMASVATLEEP